MSPSKRAGGDHRTLVFVVDDDPDINDMIRIFLRDYDWDIESFPGGRECLERVRREPLPDVIILDVMMPLLNGWETCQRLHEDPTTCGIPIVFMTAKARKEDYEAGLRCGGVLYIQKGNNIRNDMDRIRKILEKRCVQP